MSNETRPYIIKSSFFSLLTALTTTFFKILITNKTLTYETTPTSHPYFTSVIFFLGKSFTLIIFFFSDSTEEIEEELPLPKLTPNISSTSISLPKIDFSTYKGDYSLTKSKYPSSKRFPLSISITLFPSLLHYLSILLKCFALSFINTGLFQFTLMTLTLNAFTIEFYTKTNVITKQNIIAYVTVHVAIAIGIVYYLVINDTHQCLSIVFICVSNVLHFVVMYMNTIVIKPTTKTTSLQLHGTEGVLSLIIGIVVLVCSCNISCVKDVFVKRMFCGGHGTIEQFISFFKGDNYESGVRFGVMCLFMVCVFVYYCSEKHIHGYMMYENNKVVCVGNLICGVIVWIVFSFVEGFGIVKEEMRVVDGVIGLIVFGGLLIGAFVFEMTCFNKEQGNGVIKEVPEDEEEEERI